MTRDDHIKRALIEARHNLEYLKGLITISQTDSDRLAEAMKALIENTGTTVKSVDRDLKRIDLILQKYYRIAL
jgi:hypothetical protein